MNEMIGHIFGSLDIHERAISNIYGAIKAQKKLNKRTAFTLLFTTLTVTKLISKVEKQNKKIESITKELEELKQTKGE